MAILITTNFILCLYLLIQISISGIWKTNRHAIESIKCVYFTIATGSVLSQIFIFICKPWDYDVPAIRLLITLCLMHTVINILIVSSLNKRRCDYSQRGMGNVRHEIN